MTDFKIFLLDLRKSKIKNLMNDYKALIDHLWKNILMFVIEPKYAILYIFTIIVLFNKKCLI